MLAVRGGGGAAAGGARGLPGAGAAAVLTRLPAPTGLASVVGLGHQGARFQSSGLSAGKISEIRPLLP